MSSSFQRKFLLATVPTDADAASARTISQAYWRLGDGWSLRLRHEVDASGDTADSLTIKGRRAGAATVVFKLPLADPSSSDEHEARRAFFAAAGEHVVLKTRVDWTVDGHQGWVDTFQDRNDGLVIAEFEHDTEAESTAMPYPRVADREVTSEPEYANESLAYRPFQAWT